MQRSLASVLWGADAEKPDANVLPARAYHRRQRPRLASPEKLARAKTYKELVRRGVSPEPYQVVEKRVGRRFSHETHAVYGVVRAAHVPGFSGLHASAKEIARLARCTERHVFAAMNELEEVRLTRGRSVVSEGPFVDFETGETAAYFRGRDGKLSKRQSLANFYELGDAARGIHDWNQLSLRGAKKKAKEKRARERAEEARAAAANASPLSTSSTPLGGPVPCGGGGPLVQYERSADQPPPSGGPVRAPRGTGPPRGVDDVDRGDAFAAGGWLQGLAQVSGDGDKELAALARLPDSAAVAAEEAREGDVARTAPDWAIAEVRASLAALRARRAFDA